MRKSIIVLVVVAISITGCIGVADKQPNKNIDKETKNETLIGNYTVRGDKGNIFRVEALKQSTQKEIKKLNRYRYNTIIERKKPDPLNISLTTKIDKNKNKLYTEIIVSNKTYYNRNQIYIVNNTLYDRMSGNWTKLTNKNLTTEIRQLYDILQHIYTLMKDSNIINNKTTNINQVLLDLQPQNPDFATMKNFGLLKQQVNVDESDFKVYINQTNLRPDYTSLNYTATHIGQDKNQIEIGRSTTYSYNVSFDVPRIITNRDVDVVLSNKTK